MKRIAAVILAIGIVIGMTGCADSKKNEKLNTAQVGKVQAIGQGESTMASPVNVVSSDDSTNRKELRFGKDAAFNGIAVETDENGELVVNEINEIILIKVIDKRFTTEKKLKKFIRNQFSGDSRAAMLNVADTYFAELNGAVYLVNGTSERTIKDSKRYTYSCYDDKGDMLLTISSEHTRDCRNLCGLAKSHLDFVRSDGTWLLDGITLYY